MQGNSLYTNLYGGDFMANSHSGTVACPQCGYRGAPILKIRDNEFLIKCQCCPYTVHTTEIMAQLIEIWNTEAEKCKLNGVSEGE